ncbi:hypothetical protein [Agromyces sp. NPDC058110]|uniref:hypothetical protein n=1 Tax=Agromyces sp. NPDC058110 TaxID=3346345 RepID=UPI0036D88DF3
MPVTFDVRGYARTAQGSLRGELDLDAIALSPRALAARETIATLAELEGATMTHLRNVLVTSTHKDARVTAFLVSWAYEKYWIADALRRISGAGPAEAVGAGRVGTAPVGAGPGPVRRALAGFVQGPDIVGAHLALGQVDDLVLDLAYERLQHDAETGADEDSGDDAEVGGDGAADVVVATLGGAVARIRSIKARHSAFFEGETRSRLAGSARASRLARRELRRSAWPLGAAAVTKAERLALVRFAVPTRDRRERLAHDIRSVPGLDRRTADAVVRRLGA